MRQFKRKASGFKVITELGREFQSGHTRFLMKEALARDTWASRGKDARRVGRRLNRGRALQRSLPDKIECVTVKSLILHL